MEAILIKCSGDSMNLDNGLQYYQHVKSCSQPIISDKPLHVLPIDLQCYVNLLSSIYKTCSALQLRSKGH